MQGSELEEGEGEEDEDSDGSEESDPESEGENEVSEEGENDEEDEAVVDEEEEEEESGNGVLEGAFGCGNDLDTRRYESEYLNRGWEVDKRGRECSIGKRCIYHLARLAGLNRFSHGIYEEVSSALQV